MKNMKIAWLVALCAGQAVLEAAAASAETNPMQKVLEMLSKMQADIIKDGEEQHHAYKDFSHMCEERSTELQHETKTAKAEVEDLKATINKANDDEGEADSQIEELSSMLAMAETDLKASTKIRKKEFVDFSEEQKDLLDTISQMQRAMSIIEKQMKGGASFAQMSSSMLELQQQRAAALTEALAAIVDASFVSSADAGSLGALIQTSESESAGDADLDAAADSYTSNQKADKGSSSILDTLSNLLEKAQTSLEVARMKETKSAANFELFKASLQRKIETGTKDMNDVKKEKAEAGQNRAEAQGEVEVVITNLEEDKKALGELHHECMTRAADFEDETKSRDDELKALAVAKKVLEEMTGGAEKEMYHDFAQVSFMQTRSRDSTGATSPVEEVAEMMRQLSRKQKVPSLVQISHQMDSVIRTSEISGADPFEKVKGMLQSMLKQIVKQMQEEASHKVYCDKEMTETKKHKDIKDASEEKLSTRIDTQTSRSMNLKRQVAALQKEIGANLKTQADVDSMRMQEHAVFEKTKPELEQGLEGVKKALKVLREYYSVDEEKAPDASGGGGSGIISMLEVIESDFSKGLSSLTAQEDTAQAEYEAQTNENKLAKKIKEQDVVFKTKEAKSLDKATSESSSDLEGVQTELDAINEYFSKIQQECVAKPDSYEERRKRQQLTLQGLKDAAQILEGNAALLQGTRRMRGSVLRRDADMGGEQDLTFT